MPATLFPVAIGPMDILPHFAGLGELLADLSLATGEPQTDLFARYARIAQSELERSTRIPFFVTRYCTRELATQLSLTLGTDYDRVVQPLDFDHDQWLYSTGRLHLGHSYILSPLTNLRISSGQNGQLYDVPGDWLNLDAESGEVHSLTGGGAGNVSLISLGGFTPALTRNGQRITPFLVHARYRAGLVTLPAVRTDYEPATAISNTEWDPDLVALYQSRLALYGAGEIMQRLTSALDGGGASVSFDGLSVQVSPEVLWERGKAAKDEALAWGQRARDGTQGMAAVFV